MRCSQNSLVEPSQVERASYCEEQEGAGHSTRRQPKYQVLLRDAIGQARGRLSAAKPRVLDVGCSDGWSLEEWQRRGCAVCGVDLSKAKVEDARGAGLPVARMVLGLDTIPHAAETFDCVFCSHTLEHIPEAWLPSALEEIAGVLKRGGLAFLIVPFEGVSAGHRTVFRAEATLVGLVADAGFSEVTSVLKTRLQREQWVEGWK